MCVNVSELRSAIQLGPALMIMRLLHELIHPEFSIRKSDKKVCQPCNLTGVRARAAFVLPSDFLFYFLYFEDRDLWSSEMMYKHRVSAEHSVCALTWSDRSINAETMQRAVGSLTCCAKKEQVRVISSLFLSCHDYLEGMLKLGFILYLPLLLWWLTQKNLLFLRSQI